MSKITYPYYDARPEYYERLTEGMSDKAKQSFANALAHHMMPVYRTEQGWYMTRKDKILKGRPFDMIDFETAEWKYNVEGPPSE